MGLDMYLTRKVYVGNKHRTPAQQLKIKYPAKENQKGVMFPVSKEDIDVSKISYIDVEAAYWRKANAIHEWFVQNVQEGNDDCKEYYVEHEQVERLVDACKTVLEQVNTDTPLPKDSSDWQQWADIKVLDNSVCEAYLPAQEGFFFGSTEYDGMYLYDLKQTVEMLEPFLEKREDGFYKDNGEFAYRASW